MCTLNISLSAWLLYARMYVLHHATVSNRRQQEARPDVRFGFESAAPMLAH